MAVSQEALRATMTSTPQLAQHWDDLFEGKSARCLESVLPAYLKCQRWFAGKARAIQRASLLDVLQLEDIPEVTADAQHPASSAPEVLAVTRMLLVQVDYAEGDPDTYLLPVIFAQGLQREKILADRPTAGILSVTRISDGAEATLCDTTHEREFWLLLFHAIQNGRSIPGKFGTVEPRQTQAFAQLTAGLALDATVHGGEQSNTSAVLGRQLILKLFRRLNEGENPDLEIGQFLTEQTRLACVPRVAGALEYQRQDAPPITLTVVHEYVPHQGDAWVYTLDELKRFLERVETEMTGPPAAEVLPLDASPLSLLDYAVPSTAQALMGSYLQSAMLLGQRTAELHLALASGTAAAFTPQAFSKLYQRSLFQSMQTEARTVFALLRQRISSCSTDIQALIETLLPLETKLLEKFAEISTQRMTALRIRCHGDYHLGQVLYTGHDFRIIDFEGEPARSIGERRIKRSPLRDVAGMIRSFHYATHAALRSSHGACQSKSAAVNDALAWVNAWYNWCSAAFLKAYLAEAASGSFLPQQREELQVLLKAYLLEKAVYELNYELNNRPAWVAIPLEGILQLLQD